MDGFHDGVDCLGNGRKLSAHRRGHLAILSIHQADDLTRGHAIEVLGRGVAVLATPEFFALGVHSWNYSGPLE
jgi:hypothetical protein